MDVRIGSWNARNLFEGEANSSSTLDTVEKLDADVLIVSEAFTSQPSEATMTGLGQLGYSVDYVDRQSDDPRNGKYLAVLDRLELDKEVIDLGNRKGFRLSRDDFSIYGTHLSDKSEEFRTESIEDFLSLINPNNPNVLGGDLNAMIRRGTASQILGSRLASAVANRIPDTQALKLGRVKSLATRLCEMADGRSMQMLLDAGFVDSDTSNRPTMKMGRIPLVRLDHIMIGPNVHSKSVDYVNNNHADHIAISSAISTTLNY